MKVYIASDHTGFELKAKLKVYLESLGLGYDVEDVGPFVYDKDDDYPDFIKPLAEKVAKDEGSRGIILGGSGQGEAICANRVPGARAALFYGQAVAQQSIDINGEKSADPFEIVKLACKHNLANILSLAMRFLSEDEIKFAAELFLKTDHSTEERHIRRVKKLG